MKIVFDKLQIGNIFDTALGIDVGSFNHKFSKKKHPRLKVNMPTTEGQSGVIIHARGK
jgi:hypothetical protein